VWDCSDYLPPTARNNQQSNSHAAATETQPIRPKKIVPSINIANKHTQLPVNPDNTGLTDNKLIRKSNWLIDIVAPSSQSNGCILCCDQNGIIGGTQQPIYVHYTRPCFFCNNRGLRPRGEYCLERVRASSWWTAISLCAAVIWTDPTCIGQTS
jgi:hypothetical protein